MNKNYLSFLVLVGVAGAALFWQDIAAAFAGMTPLEALKTIATYLLHVAIGTVAAVVVFGLPKIVQPWMRYFRKHQRNKWRSGAIAQWQSKTPRMPRLTAEQKFWLLMMRANQNGRIRRYTPMSNLSRKMNIKW